MTAIDHAGCIYHGTDQEVHSFFFPPAMLLYTLKGKMTSHK